jgi:hypothetical protein
VAYIRDNFSVLRLGDVYEKIFLGNVKPIMIDGEKVENEFGDLEGRLGGFIGEKVGDLKVRKIFEEVIFIRGVGGGGRGAGGGGVGLRGVVDFLEEAGFVGGGGEKEVLVGIVERYFDPTCTYGYLKKLIQAKELQKNLEKKTAESGRCDSRSGKTPKTEQAGHIWGN